MSALVPVNGTVPVPAKAPATPADLNLQVEDSLASNRRLWVRGRLTGLPLSQEQNGNGDRRRWWGRKRAKEEPTPPPPLLTVETRLSSHVLKAETPLEADGRFEAVFDTQLPQARRGWRVARNHVTCLGQTTEACSLVLAPPAQAAGAIVVILPLEFTSSPHGPQLLERSSAAIHLTRFLRSLEQDQDGKHSVYYLGHMGAEDADLQAKLALAATALGWPAGHFILLTGMDTNAGATLRAGLDRLRWLFAGELDLVVVNLEPRLHDALQDRLGPMKDRAVVRRLVSPEEAFAQDQNRTPSSSTLRRTRAGLLPRYPLVFCHGMLAMSALRMRLPDNLNCFSPLGDFLAQRGCQALFPQVPPTSGIVERAQCLREEIRAWTRGPINVIAHSMGGLDARYLITHLGMADQVRSLTTISTPHRGTYLADWFVANFRRRVPLLLALEALGLNMDGFRDCRLEECQAFNLRTPDRPEVRYYSYGGQVSPMRLTPMLRRSWNLLKTADGPNDGMVSMPSAHWGEYLGTIAADHFAQTPDAVFLRPGEDFDSLGFYTRLVEDLARRGF